MASLAISSKGQITLPARLRRQVGLALHEKVQVLAEGDHLVVRKADSLLKWQGALGKAKADERGVMQDEVADQVRGKKK
jgi:AbrB family looped-hinge helix DNA binding protein